MSRKATKAKANNTQDETAKKLKLWAEKYPPTYEELQTQFNEWVEKLTPKYGARAEQYARSKVLTNLKTQPAGGEPVSASIWGTSRDEDGNGFKRWRGRERFIAGINNLIGTKQMTKLRTAKEKGFSLGFAQWKDEPIELEVFAIDPTFKEAAVKHYKYIDEVKFKDVEGAERTLPVVYMNKQENFQSGDKNPNFDKPIKPSWYQIMPGSSKSAQSNFEEVPTLFIHWGTRNSLEYGKNFVTSGKVDMIKIEEIEFALVTLRGKINKQEPNEQLAIEDMSTPEDYLATLEWFHQLVQEKLEFTLDDVLTVFADKNFWENLRFKGKVADIKVIAGTRRIISRDETPRSNFGDQYGGAFAQGWSDDEDDDNIISYLIHKDVPGVETLTRGDIIKTIELYGQRTKYDREARQEIPGEYEPRATILAYAVELPADTLDLEVEEVEDEE